MKMPMPTEGHRRLYRFAGRWLGDELLEPSPWGPGGPAVGRLACEIVLDGMWVASDYTEERAGAVVFRGHGLIGWDARSSEVTWAWFDSTGETPGAPARGRWDGETLVLTSRSAMGEGRYTYRFEGQDAYRLRIESSFDGGTTFQTFMEGHYSRT